MPGQAKTIHSLIDAQKRLLDQEEPFGMSQGLASNGQLGCTIATVGEEALSAAGPPEMFPPASPEPPSEELLSPGSEPPEEGSAST